MLQSSAFTGGKSERKTDISTHPYEVTGCTEYQQGMMLILSPVTLPSILTGN
jgi:hypothetical protein